MNDLEKTQLHFESMNINISVNHLSRSIPLSGFTKNLYNQEISIEADNGLDGYFTVFHFLDGKFIGHSIGV